MVVVGRAHGSLVEERDGRGLGSGWRVGQCRFWILGVCRRVGRRRVSKKCDHTPASRVGEDYVDTGLGPMRRARWWCPSCGALGSTRPGNSHHTSVEHWRQPKWGNCMLNLQPGDVVYVIDPCLCAVDWSFCREKSVRRGQHRVAWVADFRVGLTSGHSTTYDNVGIVLPNEQGGGE